MVRLALWSLVAGCYAPSAPANAPCTGNRECPDGQECIDLVCVPEGSTPDGGPRDGAGESVDAIDASTDGDADGVLDTIDNCPMRANPSQHDEDTDGRGDVCDPCPPFADDAVPVDADGDGVSDACDPWPGFADRILVFEGFADPLGQAWVASGSWTLVDDQVRVVSNDNTVSSLSIAQPTAARIAIWARGTVEQIHSGSRGFGVAQSIVGPQEAILCELVRVGGQAELALIDLGNSGSLDRVDSNFIAGTVATFRHARNAVDHTCTDGLASIVGATSTNPSDSRIGLRSNSVTGRFDWVLVVGP